MPNLSIISLLTFTCTQGRTNEKIIIEKLLKKNVAPVLVTVDSLTLPDQFSTEDQVT